MTPERWQQVRNLLQSAMQLEPEQRIAYLEQHCSDDPSLRKDVDSLLAVEHKLPASFLESPAIAHVTPDQNTVVSANWKPGMKLGPYEIQSLLGAGGMGEVYRARDTRLDRTVALKVLPALLSSDPARKQRFEREARAIAALQHPNICTLHDVGQQQGIDYLVMEYLEGETLAERLTKGPLPPEQFLRFGVETTDALDIAHRRGIVHRDLKPGNIFLTTHGECKVLDFGLAKLEESHAEPETLAPVSANQKSLTTPGLAVGTVAYMSPEQARGEELDARSDIFSLGAVLFEMATGQLAFTGKTSAMTFKAILDETPVPPTQLNKALPQKLDEIVGKALEKDRELRYQHASEMRSDLLRLKRDMESARLPVATTSAKSQFRLSWKVATPIVLIAIVALAFNPWGLLGRLLGRNASPPIQSLAVLPLENLSHDPEQEYFADGMTEELITRLAQISALKVISRTSVMRYKGTKESSPQIARALGADALIEGSIRREGDRVEITIELIEAKSDRHLWAQDYQREMHEALALQASVASAIAAKVKATLTPAEQARLQQARAVDPDVYEAYLKGRYFFERWNADGRRKALNYFRQAVAEDPGFAVAYSGLADTLTVRSYLNESIGQEERANAITAAQEALRLDNSLGEAHASLGLASMIDLHWADAERELRSALSLSPNCPNCHVWYAYYLTFTSRFTEAAEEMEKAQALDPLSSITYVAAGVMRYFSRDFNEAIRQYQKAIELDPANPGAYNNLADAYLEEEMCSAATKQFVRAEQLLGQSQNASALTTAFRISGCRGMLSKQLEFYSDPANPDYYPMFAAANAALLGKKEEAFKFLEKAYETRQGIMELAVEPELDNIRSDPRFADLLRRINLSANSVATGTILHINGERANEKEPD